MRNLLDFIVRFSSWFVFAFYVIASCVLLFDRNPYQHHVWLTSAGSVAVWMYDVSNNVTGYFSLRSINEDLQRRQADLEEEVASLRTQLRNAREALTQDSLASADSLAQFRFIVATAISNSVTRPYNYITLDKGEADGLQPEMGVMDQNGVVGVVNVTGKHYSRVISLLNPNFRLSCKLCGSDAFGSLVWDGKSPNEALLEELPKHTRFHKGDTIITSGYSALFPEGIPVGTVIGSARGADDNFFTLRVRLLTDFTALSTVKVISNRDMIEIKEVETDEADSGQENGL